MPIAGQQTEHARLSAVSLFGAALIRFTALFVQVGGYVRQRTDLAMASAHHPCINQR